MTKLLQEPHKISEYNHFRIFYGYCWESEYFDKQVLKDLMAAVQLECEEELRNHYKQDIFVDIHDLQLKEGDFLSPQLRTQIDDACIGVFEISDRNPNVYYELGHVHGAGKNVLVLRESSSPSAADLEGIVEIRYDKKNLPSMQSRLAGAICKLIHEIRSDFRWDSFLWTGIQNSPIKMYLGWKVSDFTEFETQSNDLHYLSRGDVQIMNLLRQELTPASQKRVRLETHSAVFTGEELSANVLSIGGPRRNNCTAAVFGLARIQAKTNYEFIQRQPDTDGFVEYYIRKKTEHQEEFRTELRFEKPTERKHLYGDDYGLIYKLTAPGGEPAFTWIILAGITREGTLACLDFLLNNRSAQRSIIDHSLAGEDTEILINISVINGKHMTNPEIIDIQPLKRG